MACRLKSMHLPTIEAALALAPDRFGRSINAADDIPMPPRVGTRVDREGCQSSREQVRLG